MFSNRYTDQETRYGKRDLIDLFVRFLFPVSRAFSYKQKNVFHISTSSISCNSMRIVAKKSKIQNMSLHLRKHTIVSFTCTSMPHVRIYHCVTVISCANTCHVCISEKGQIRRSMRLQRDQTQTHDCVS
jgi:hypothetical protein